jgi:hypothetical protein
VSNIAICGSATRPPSLSHRHRETAYRSGSSEELLQSGFPNTDIDTSLGASRRSGFVAKAVGVHRFNSARSHRGSPSIQVIMDANAVFTPTGKQIRDLSIIIEKLL